MEWILPAIIGWCGTRWPIHFGGGGGGGFDPDNPWPPNCPVCGPIIGAISAVILVAVIGSQYKEAGFLGTVAISFFGGNFGSNLVGSIVGMARGRTNRQ